MARAATTSRSTKTNGNGGDPAKDLDAEIAALREDISAITVTLGNIAKTRTSEARTEVERAGRKAVAKGEEAFENAQQNFEHAEDEFKTMIRDKPIQSVLVAAGIGYLLSKVLRA